ncbi:hypothetical protein [Lacticaseibacillus rhamnosus]|uniref:hypothetical protein n=1 Tax=Lacticaseibacillus rhamnosus TaxID=47715 RepID=UPI0008A322AF|nr:hypothetical protein [Lacticaseibacillus rhamnosus]MDK7184071.1 glycosyl transferase [Lacticaseibacillus rhamnosus]MDK7241228.1 glycosyl transferase [Lacticaseibacillus rhamnosus]OFN13072.1 hypothetical protein HMPREF2621_00430 [Lactobacillus sp. HMSC072E07]
MISLDTKNQKSFNAGSKAREDVTYFLEKRGILPFVIDSGSSSFFAIRELNRLSSFYNLAKKLTSYEEVIVQYPLNINFIDKLLLKVLLKSKRSKLILLVHDLVSVQGFDPKKKIKDEISEFNDSNGIITHNQAMSEFLLKNGLNVRQASIDFFDYYSKENINNDVISNHFNHIIFAGNLAKSKFLLQIPKMVDLTWDIFGAGISPKQLPNFVNFHGPVAPENLPAVLPKGWGLVWDGDRADAISGIGGEYLKINSPHKASLYLAAGLPLIVWQKSALAALVEGKHLGIAVNSLQEIDLKIRSIDKSTFITMQKSVEEYSALIRHGGMLENALLKLKGAGL